MQRVLIMSRAGKYPVATKGVQVQVQGQKVTVKGPKGELSFTVPDVVKFSHANDEFSFEPKNESKEARMQWGTSRRVIGNMIKGVQEGFAITLDLVGVGYRAAAQGNLLNLFLGYSHEIKFAVPAGITVQTPQQTEVIISGADKQLVGQIAAEIRQLRKPEPYKGKGVRRRGEFVRRKEGKKK